MPDYSSALLHVGVAVQTGIGVPATAPTVFFQFDRAGGSLMEWLTGRTPIDRSTGDYYTEVGAPVVGPHSEGTLVVPADLSNLNDFLAMGGIAGGADPGAVLVPPLPMTIFQGLGYKEEIWSDVFFAKQPMFSVTDKAFGTWTIPLLGMMESEDDTVLVADYPPYEEPWRMSDLRPSTLIASAGVNKFSSFKATLIIDTEPQFYSRGDGLPNPSDMTLIKLGAFLDFRCALEDSLEKGAFEAICGQPGALKFPFSRTCGEVTNTLAFNLTNGLHTVRKVDAPDRGLIGQTFTTRGLRGPVTPFSPVRVAYT